MAGAVTLIAVTLLLVYVYRTLAVKDLVRGTEEQNVAIGLSISNALWPDVSRGIARLGTVGSATLRTLVQEQEVDQSVRSAIRGLPVLKVKMYGLDGLTIYSSQTSEIGELKASNKSFLQSAISGVPASVISFREMFAAISGEVHQRHIVESYLPIHGPDGAIEGIFELYTDVTPTVLAVESRSNDLTAGLLLLFFMVYGILFVIVRHADRIIKRQYAELQATAEQRRLAERKMDIARKEAESASLAKTDFLANMSHELRTPLNAIIGFSEVIKEGALGPVGNAKYLDYVHDIHTSARHLLGLINDVLDLSRIEAGKLKLTEEAVDPAEIIQLCLTMLRQEAERKNISLLIDLPGGAPPLVADARLLKQVFINLLSNAIKFTPEEGTVTVSGEISRDGCQVFRVHDTGIGIPKEEIPRILEPFTQIETALAQRHEGSGLGLPLAKKFVELHGGILGIVSEAGHGTTITVQFPAARGCRPLSRDGTAPFA